MHGAPCTQLRVKTKIEFELAASHAIMQAMYIWPAIYYPELCMHNYKCRVRIEIVKPALEL